MAGELSNSLKAAAEEARREARSVKGAKQDDSVTQSELLETVGAMQDVLAHLAERIEALERGR
jgi:hypothetical protein